MLADREAPALAALDWGTTSLRAYLLAESGTVLERRAEPWGILQLPDRDFARAFDAITQGWSSADSPLPAIASGMIGSAQGWVNAPYASLPADAASVALDLAPVADRDLLIVPGLVQRTPPDVMRGEETQLFGAIERVPSLATSATVVMPGTHSKLVRIADGRIDGFATYMTGELYAVLRSHSILGRLADAADPAGPASGAAFLRGVRRALEQPSGLSTILFSARSAVLVGQLEAAESLEYLSGLLIGDEIRSGLEAGPRPNALIGDDALCRRYAEALAEFGVHDVAALADTAPAGLWRIARLARREPQRTGR